MFAAMGLMFASNSLNQYMPDKMKICSGASTQAEEDVCLANGFIGRMSFILACFHLMVFVICLARNEMAAGFHDGCWGFKFLLITAGYVASFWMDAGFFTDFYMPLS
jgi:hypothetical protein